MNPNCKAVTDELNMIDGFSGMRCGASVLMFDKCYTAYGDCKVTYLDSIFLGDSSYLRNTKCDAAADALNKIDGIDGVGCQVHFNYGEVHYFSLFVLGRTQCNAVAAKMNQMVAAAPCNRVGTYQSDGTCSCTTPNAIGHVCQCNGVGTAQAVRKSETDGTCVCNGGFLGSACEYSDATTCSNFGVVNSTGQCTCTQQQSVRNATNGCACLGPESGLGPTCSELSNTKTCTDHGVAQPDGTCLCSTGYTGASCAGECATETHTRWDEPSAGGGFECHANFGESCDRGFYFNADTTDPTSRTCTICPVNTYADGILEDGQYDGGKRIACKSCPDEFQVSPAGSVSVDQCQYKWKILDASSDTMQATMAAGFCTGLDAESTLHFTTMTNGPADCQEFADTKQLTFSSDVPKCEDLAASEDCELVCGAARAGKSIDVTTNAGGKESAAEACKVTCGLCDSGTTAGLATRVCA